MKITRREFAARASGAALLGGTIGFRRLFGKARPRPNILLLMTDEQHLPPLYGLNEVCWFSVKWKAGALR